MSAVTNQCYKSFRLDQLLSKNDVAESWAATNIATDNRCFLKVLSEESKISRDLRVSLLSRSFALQKSLNRRYVLRARNKQIIHDRLFVEYPFHDPDIWSPLTPKLLLEHWIQVIVQLASIIDYLHHLGLVHLDLKLENFHARVSSQGVKVKLVDLDFLTTVGTPLDAKIIGTPNLIAPEVLKNDEISARTDIYSFGRSLKRSLFSDTNEPAPCIGKSVINVEKLRALVNTLSNQYPAKRPTFLLDFLQNHGFLSDKVYNSAQKTLLSTLLTSRIHRIKSGSSNGKDWLKSWLQNENKVFGIPDEFIRDLEAAFKKNQLKAILLFRQVLAGSILTSYGEFWHLELSDRTLTGIYRQTDSNIFQEELPAPPNGNKSALKNFLKNKLIMEELSLSSSHGDRAKRRVLLREQANLALTLHRTDDAITYFRSALEASEPNTKNSLALLQRLTPLLMATGSHKECAALAERGNAESTFLSDREAGLEFQRHRAGTFAYKGDTDTASELLADSLRQAKALGILPLQMRIYNSMAALEWRKGNTDLAMEHYRQVYGLAGKSNNMTLGAVALVGMALFYSEMAEYSKAIRMGTLAAKYVDKDSDPTKLLLIYEILAWCQQRLGNSKKAEYWVNKFISEKSPNKDQRVFLEYYIMKGWLNVNKGAMSEAKEALYRGLEISHSTEDPRRIGKTLINLAEISMAQGMPELCQQYCSQARESFEAVRDHASLCEIELIFQLNLYYNTDDSINNRLVNLLPELIDRNCRYYGALCLLHILLNADSNSCAEALAKAEPLREQLNNSKAPVFRAVRSMMHASDTDAIEHVHRLSQLKNAFSTLESSGQTFLAALLAKEIGERYLRSSQRKLGRRFLEQSKQLAESLGNHLLSESISDALTTNYIDPDERRRLVNTIFGISNILQNSEQYDQAMRQIVQFAVEETGAERGALLLESPESGHLAVQSYWNCDENSLKDIIDFSTSIPEQVAQEFSPVIVSDALKDDRTKNYKSIVVHNIRSVICVPVRIKNGQKGILYLDHHTIPALFEDDDLMFVKSLANFLSLMLSTLKHIRTADLDRRRIEEELVNAGISQQLITQSDRMLEIVQKLPQIARSKASVLVTGQSGTGKEILSQMLHCSSYRASGPLVKLNCAAIPYDLIESELFGVDKGVATGVDAREGKFETADGGTLILDEIGDLPLNVQAKVLRVLEYQEFERVGSNRRIRTDIRFIYATNRDLRKMVAKGEFREDLFHRINTIVIEVPSLRERPEDIQLLIQHFIESFSPHPETRPSFSATAMNALEAYSWPGNIRELKNFVERCCILLPGRILELTDLPNEIEKATKSGSGPAETCDAVEKTRIRKALATFNWNKTAAAKHLGLSRATLRRKMEKYSICRDF